MATPTYTRASSPRSLSCSASPTPTAPSSHSTRARAPWCGRHRSRCARHRATAPPRHRAAAPPRRHAAAPQRRRTLPRRHAATPQRRRTPPRRHAATPSCRLSHRLSSRVRACTAPCNRQPSSPSPPLSLGCTSPLPHPLLPSVQVWVNGGSASSSEVLAGALHDNCRASVVGSRSFGKGLIQGVFGLSDGGALVTTVASYATPNGREINLQGAASMLRESASWRRQSWPPTARGALFLPCAWQPAWPFCKTAAAWGPPCSPKVSPRRRHRPLVSPRFNYPGVAVDDTHTFWSDVWGSSFVGLDISSARFQAPMCMAKPEIAAQ